MFENGSAEMNFAHFFLLEHPKVNLQVALLLKDQVIQAGMLEIVLCTTKMDGRTSQASGTVSVLISLPLAAARRHSLSTVACLIWCR